MPYHKAKEVSTVKLAMAAIPGHGHPTLHLNFHFSNERN